MSGTSAWPLPLGVAVTDAGATTDGGGVSTTVKLVEAVAALPAASVTVTVTRLEPTPTRVPAAGCCAFRRAAAGVQLSETTNPVRKSGTAALPLLPAEAVGAGSGEMTGAVVSTTVNEVVTLERFPAASVTVIVTRVEPRPTSDPAFGFCAFCNDPAGLQLSEASKPVRKSGTRALPWLSAEEVRGPGAVTTGGVVSLTTRRSEEQTSEPQSRFGT